MSFINVRHPVKLYLLSKCYYRKRTLILSSGELINVLSVNSEICEGGCVALKLCHCTLLIMYMMMDMWCILTDLFFRNLQFSFTNPWYLVWISVEYKRQSSLIVRKGLTAWHWKGNVYFQCMLNNLRECLTASEKNVCVRMCACAWAVLDMSSLWKELKKIFLKWNKCCHLLIANILPIVGRLNNVPWTFNLFDFDSDPNFLFANLQLIVNSVLSILLILLSP